MKILKQCLITLICLGSLAINAQVTLLGTSVYDSPSIPTQAFGAVFACSSDSINHITRQYNMFGNNGRKVFDMDVMQASDGRIYGVTQEGSSIFSIDTLTGTYALEFLFPSFIQNPCGSFVQASNDKFYGLTVSGGAYLNGVLYEYDPISKTCIKKIDFVEKPTGSLLLASDGKLYGLKSSGMYRYDPITNSFYDSGSAFFGTATGAGYLLQASDGKIYGHTTGAGFSPIGNIFAFDPIANTTSVVFTFPRKTIFSFCNGFMQASNGKFYGLVYLGPASSGSLGSIFEFDPTSGAFAFNYDFDYVNGSYPKGRMIQASNGKLYGTTSEGALNNNGGIFEFDIASNVCSNINDFGGSFTSVAGSGSRSGLLKVTNDRCYGLTYLGGIGGIGDFFEYNMLTNSRISKFSFDVAENGANPNFGLNKTSTGKFYGTAYGGVSTEGVIFEYEPITNTYSKKIDFNDYDLRDPRNGLTEMADGTFFGAASYDSLDASGFYSISAIYQWNPVTNIVIRRSLFLGSLNKLSPWSDLLLAADGKLYGTGLLFPVSGPSTVVLYSFDPTTSVCSLLYDYGSVSNNMMPTGSLLQASNGKIYGTIAHNGATISGRLFEYDIPSGVFTDTYFFDGTTLGKVPGGGLIEVSPGKLFGVVSTGTISGDYNGQIYEYDILSSTCTMEFQFTRATDGLYPFGELLAASNGKFYGLTKHGKVSLNGTVFEYDPVAATLRSILEMDETNGLKSVRHLVEYSTPLPPMIGSVNSVKTICDFSATTINVSVFGTGPLSFQWQLNFGSGWTNVPASMYYSGMLSSVLSIDSVIASMDSTYFRCVVNSPYGSDTSSTIQLFVKALLQPVIVGPAAICPSSTVLLSVTSIPNANYAWQYNGTFIPGANDSIYLTSGSGSYTVIASNSFGCSDTSASFFLVYGFLPLVSSSSANAALFCPGDSALLYSDYTSSTYQWLLNNVSIAGASDSTLQVFSGGQYSLITYSPEGCSDTSGVINVRMDCDTWPGDADNDSLVDNNDLLTIGLHYGETGPARSTISNVWQAWPSTDWGVFQTNGQDVKQADCNGDGIIDNNDTLAVNLNFSLTHAFAPTTNDQRLTIPDIYLVTGSSSYLPGDWVDAELWLGTSSVPVNNLYGIAFNINYDASLVQSGSENLTYSNSWLGNPGVDVIKLSKIDGLAAIAYGAETRINHNNADGFGKIANFKFQLKNTITISDTLNLSISYYNSVDSLGNSILFNLQDLTIQIPVGINEYENINDINIYPNPYLLSTQITYSLLKPSNVSVEVYNTIGQRIETLVNANQYTGEYKYSFSAKEKGCDAGIYFVKFTIDGKITMKKIVEVK